VCRSSDIDIDQILPIITVAIPLHLNGWHIFARTENPIFFLSSINLIKPYIVNVVGFLWLVKCFGKCIYLQSMRLILHWKNVFA